MTNQPTAEQILDVAEDLIRERGYNAISYADISRIIGIRKASIHYHFPTKAELGRVLIQRYCDRFFQRRRQLEQIAPGPSTKLSQFIGLFAAGLAGDKICLCNILSADCSTLPDAINQEVVNFIENNVAWLTRVLNDGSQNGDWELADAPEDDAHGLLATLQGAQLIARLAHEPERTFNQALQPWRSHFGLMAV
ncbi:MAG: TetR/AcrR family transcriptional regulator [Cyanobacteria bacterium P01_H01_bin.15]